MTLDEKHNSKIINELKMLNTVDTSDWRKEDFMVNYSMMSRLISNFK